MTSVCALPEIQSAPSGICGNTWIISDTHFGHKNIISYCARPFFSVTQMNTTLINNWNSVVQPDDEVYHLGDFGFGKPDDLRYWRAQLVGKIHLIRGNHDRVATAKLVKDIGFASVAESLVLTCPQAEVYLRHKPLETQDEVSEWVKIHSASTTDRPYVLLHGHIHNFQLPNNPWWQKNVSVEMQNYRPRLLNEVVWEVLRGRPAKT